MIRLSFDRKFVPLVAPFTGQRDIRYYLNGIRVEAAGDRPGVYIVGCDGHRLTVAYDKDGTIEGDDGAGVIIRQDRAFILACKARSSVPLKVLAIDKRVFVSAEGAEPHNKLETYVMPGDPWITGNYPKWRAVLPCWADLKLGFAAEVAAQYLSDYAVLGKDGGVTFWQVKEGDPIVVQHSAHSELLSILMPRRFDDYDRKRFGERLLAIHPGKQKESTQ